MHAVFLGTWHLGFHPQKRVFVRILPFLYLIFLDISGAFAVPPQINAVQPLVPLENLLTGMVLEPAGTLLVLENDSGELSRLRPDRAGNALSIETVTAGMEDPIALVQHPNGGILIAERRSGRILQLEGGILQEMARDFTDISALDLDDQDYLWITELEPGRLTRFNLLTKNRIHPGRIGIPQRRDYHGRPVRCH